MFFGAIQFSQIRACRLPCRRPQRRRRPGSLGRRSENTYRKKFTNKQALSVANAPKRSQGRTSRRSRRRSRHQGLAQALRRREGGSATPAVAGEAGARLSEETAAKGGQRRDRSARKISLRTIIRIFTYIQMYDTRQDMQWQGVFFGSASAWDSRNSEFLVKCPCSNAVFEGRLQCPSRFLIRSVPRRERVRGRGETSKKRPLFCISDYTLELFFGY